ncbi:MAG TPA: leucine-rich repeat protein, partial [Verrucomicrobiae bacterium]|nr:leucine-rich repeat protein [Verrucomicrobiae bacterium]
MTFWGKGLSIFQRSGCQLGLAAVLILSRRCMGEEFYNGYYYDVSGNNITINLYTGPGGDITVPSSFPGVVGTVTAIGQSAFEDNTNLTSVVIPAGVTSLGSEAFALCSGLTN